MKDGHALLYGQFAQRFTQQTELAQLIAQLFGLDVRMHKIYPHIKQRKLVVITERPELSALLKQQANIMLAHIKQHYQDKAVAQQLVGVTVKTGEPQSLMTGQTAPSQRAQKKPLAAPMSDEVFDRVQSIASGIEDEGLRDSFMAFVDASRKPVSE